MPTIVVNTNSYVDLTQADTILDEMYLTEDWFLLDDDAKAKLLISATKLINKLPIKYDPFDPAQKLPFPVLIEGASAGLTEAQEATILQAWYMYRNTENIQSAQDESISNVKSQDIGPIKTVKASSGFNPFKMYEPEVFTTLSKYIEFSFKLKRA